MNSINITPSSLIYNKEDFVDAEKYILGDLYGPVSIDTQKIIQGIHFFINKLGIDISSKEVIYDIYTKLKLSDSFEYNGIANRINEILGFEKNEIENLKEKNYKLKQYANIDSLTGITNRGKFDRLFNFEVDKGEIFSLLFFDLDYFKHVNDTYGHLSGDLVLKEVAKEIQGKIRSKTEESYGDIFARYGGEEFIIIMPGTDIEGGEKFSERIRQIIEDMTIIDDYGKEIKVTISIGVVEREYGDSMNSLLKRADDALYEAKKSGRNRVLCIKKYFLN